MDFHQLLAKMQEIDSSTPKTEANAEECVMPPVDHEPMAKEPVIPPPSMSVNINAQGMDNIEDMMKLLTKVNPDMMPMDPMPLAKMSMEPNIVSLKPAPLPPLTMLPDYDADNDNMPGGEKDHPLTMMDLPPEHDKDHELVKDLDKDGDGDHDMDDHDIEKKEAWANEPEEEEKNVDYMVNKLAGGMNRSQATYPKVADGDNPMQKITRMGENVDLKDQIRAELRKRLAESKTAQLDEGPLDMLKKAGGAVKGAFKGAVTGAKKAMATPGGGTAQPKQALGKVVKAPAGGAGVSPAQAQQSQAQKSLEVDITPEIGSAVSAKFKQISDDIADGAYPNLKNVKAMVDSYLDSVAKKSGGVK